MKPPLLLPHYSSRSVNFAGKRYFVDEQGNRLPSVTSILNATKPFEEKKALLEWRSRIGSQEANRITRNASRRGVSLHKQLHHHLLGEAVTIPEVAKPYWESIQPVLKDIDEIRLIEGTVFHYDLRYSGRVDCVASYRGVPCVLDWKTADRPKTSDRLRDAPLQLAAYCGAVNQFYRSENLCLNHLGVVVAIPERPAQVFWFEPNSLQEYWQQWEKRVEAFWHQDNSSPD